MKAYIRSYYVITPPVSCLFLFFVIALGSNSLTTRDGLPEMSAVSGSVRVLFFGP